MMDVSGSLSLRGEGIEEQCTISYPDGAALTPKAVDRVQASITIPLRSNCRGRSLTKSATFELDSGFSPGKVSHKGRSTITFLFESYM